MVSNGTMVHYRARIKSKLISSPKNIIKKEKSPVKMKHVRTLDPDQCKMKLTSLKASSGEVTKST